MKLQAAVRKKEKEKKGPTVNPLQENSNGRNLEAWNGNSRIQGP
jgi:hypothetical protein